MSDGWAKLINCRDILEADMLVERLKASDLLAMSRNRGVGAGYESLNLLGVDVLVPVSQLDEARAILDDIDAEGVSEEPGVEAEE